jgi:dienelactone hydrolase
VAAAVAVALSSGGGPAPGRPASRAAPARPAASDRHSSAASRNAAKRGPGSFAVGLRTLRLVDTSRTIRVGGASRPRTLLTYVRYPALGSPGGGELANALPARADGPFPLVVFGHGFAVTPGPYRRLLDSWASAGYVVAAPVFPLENANAPGGPDESDLVNQPADMSFVITRLLAAAAAGSDPLSGLLDPRRIAASGQSDGGETALAVAYDSQFRDPRVGAALILSGAKIPGVGGFTFPRGSPPLLATQGTSDTVNPPALTAEFFDSARRPKYLLRLPGAGHLPPYTEQQPQLGIVERVAIAFLDGYLKDSPAALRRLRSLGTVPGVASLLAQP